MKTLFNFVSITIAVSFLLCGCATGTRIKGGKTTYKSAVGSSVDFVQGQDSKDKSNVNQDSKKTTEMVIPPGSIITLEPPVTSADVTNPPPPMKITLSSNMVYRTTIEEKMESKHGAAQENSIGTTIAKLSSMRPVQFIGILVLLFGIASLWQPYLRMIVNSATTSIMLCVAGLAMIFGPLVIVGQENMILLVGGGGGLAYFFIYRYGHTSGQNKLYKIWVDKNKDGKVQDDELVDPPTTTNT